MAVTPQLPILLVEVEAARVRLTRVGGIGAPWIGELPSATEPASLLADATAAAFGGRSPAGLRIVVLLGDSRVVTSRLTAEQAPPQAERRTQLEAHARRIGLAQPGEELAVAAVETAVTEGWQAVIVAAPSTSVAAFEAVDRRAQVFVTSAEIGLAQAMAGDRVDDRESGVAVLDLRVDPARLVLVDAGGYVGSRRLKLPLAVVGGGGQQLDTIAGLDPSALVGAEIQRALRALRSSDRPAPTRLALLGAPTSVRQRLGPLAATVGLERVELLGVPSATDPKREDPGADASRWLAVRTAGALGGHAVPFLISPAPHDRWTRWRESAPTVLSGLGMLIGLGLLLFDRLGPPAARRADLAALAERQSRAERERSAREADLVVPTIVADRGAILAQLSQPANCASRLLARIAEGAGERIGLLSIEIAESGHLTVVGEVRDVDRLSAFAAFDAVLSAGPGVRQTGGGVGSTPHTVLAPSESSITAAECLVYRARLERSLP